MTDPVTESSAAHSRPVRLRAFSVHILTALGGGLALVALLEAVREHWAGMFGWLGAALIVDAIDGPIARHLDVQSVLPDWSGDTLDLVVDFVTYVFVPAYAIAASGLLLPFAAPLIGIAVVVTGALYFADRRMKAHDNHFRGFPALWNAAAFYLFLIKPGAAVATLAMALLVVLTFVPFHVMHPVRVRRLRPLNIAVIVLWGLLAVQAVLRDFRVPTWSVIALCAIAAWILFSDFAFRAVARFRS